MPTSMTSQPPKRRRLRLGLLCIFVIFAMVAVLLLQLFWPSGRRGGGGRQQTLIKISPETTAIVEPLDKSGYVDYLEALNRQAEAGVETANNAAALLWQVAGVTDFKPAMQQAYFRRLGLEMPADVGGVLIPLQAIAEAATVAGQSVPNTDEMFETASSRPWEAEEFPLIAEWLQSNAAVLEIADAASQRSRYFSPLIPEDDGLLISVRVPDLQGLRAVGRLLTVRAMLRLHQGDTSAAWQDILRIHRLAKLTSEHGLLIGRFVSMAIESQACQATVVLTQHVPLEPEQVLAMQLELAEVHPRRPVAEVVKAGERYLFLDAVTQTARHGLGTLKMYGQRATVSTELLSRVSANAFDWNLVLANGNEWYDKQLAALEEPTAILRRRAWNGLKIDIKRTQQRVEQPQRLAQALVSRRVRSEILSDVLVSLLLPAISAVGDAEARMKTRQQLEVIALALAGYQAEHGDYPDSLTQLIPKFLPDVPQDLFADKPLIYRHEDAGYIVYSVGTNLIDDGGSESQPDNKNDDIVVRTVRAVSD